MTFSRTYRTRSGSLRRNVPRNRRFLVFERTAPRFVNACGDYAPCGNCGCFCKARLGSRKPRPQRARQSDQGGVAHYVPGSTWGVRQDSLVHFSHDILQTPHEAHRKSSSSASSTSSMSTCGSSSTSNSLTPTMTRSPASISCCRSKATSWI